MEHLLATDFLLDPIVGVLENALRFLNTVTHNFGLSLVILAVAVKLVFWPLNSFQFKSITKMQALQPRMKALQAKYKNDQQKLQQETMALYKETGVNPFASCLPLLLQMPILYSLYYAINSNKAEFATTKFLWIGTPFSERARSWRRASRSPTTCCSRCTSCRCTSACGSRARRWTSSRPNSRRSWRSCRRS